jgi:hypothetical protein
MRSPTAALLWEIWRQRRWTVAVIGGLTVAGRLIDLLENGGDESPMLSTLLEMLAFALLLGVINYTESDGGPAVGRFPRRLFTLPVTTLRLVAVPLIVGVTSIELLYLLWMDPRSIGESASGPFVAVLLAAFVAFYLSILWLLERAGVLRLVVVGAITIVLFVVGLLPSFPPSPPPAWRTEAGLAGIVAGLALIAFLLAWRHVAELRAGGIHRSASFVGSIVDVWPTRRRPFANAQAAHFWYEWRLSGIVLPALVGGVLLLVVMPMSWFVRSDAADTFRLLAAVLTSPVLLAIPVGIAFSKPRFWSEDLTVPAFVAVRPVSSEDLVAIKVKVAAASAVLSWAAVLAFTTIWLSGWANLDALSRFAIQLWAFHGQSVRAVYGIAVLVVLVGMLLTWRFLVSRLWSGLSGRRPLLVAAVVWIVALVIAWFLFDAARLPGWLLGDPARLAPVAWIAAALVVAKYWTAAYAWRRVSARYRGTYLLFWLAATLSFLAFGIVVWGVIRIYVPLDVDRARSIVILVALIAVPLARTGLAPLWLARNRHR